MDKMIKRIAGLFLILSCSTVCIADDLTLRVNRDLIVKMPLLTLQPMLDFCRDQQPQLNPELEQAYTGAKVKVLKAVKEGETSVLNLNHDEALFKEEELNSPVDAGVKRQFQEALEMMSRSLQQVDSAIYCPVLIQRLNHFDQHTFQQSVEMKFKQISEQAKAQKKVILSE
jgi:hypothetical protein